ncbi:mRNA cleavage and polyadenylation factor subunit [Serendipita sp. 407]|nr:mRNA cleavage and polyadenylation factor subunit [Serendipita sp. 407]
MASQEGAAQGLSLAQLLEPTMLGIYNEILPPSGVEFAVFLNLGDLSFSHQLSVQFKHLAVGRSNVLRIYEVRQHLADTDSEDKPEIRSPEHTGYRLHLLRQHLLHGIITGLAAVQTLASDADGRDRLLVSFEDAKLALLEWSDALYDITTVSIHTYERSVYLLNAEFASSRVQLRTDPSNRCAALIFPRDAIALLPWYQTQAEFDLQDSVQTHTRDLPYSPSFIVKYSSMDERIRNVVDVAFLPGFNTPTIAVLFQPQQTWSGRLKECKDNTSLFLISLDLVAKSYQVITEIENLPYDPLYLIPCSSNIGGVMILTTNAILHVDQASKITSLATNGWARRVTDTLIISEEPPSDVHLEGSRAAFLSDNDLLVVLVNGIVMHVHLDHEGRLVRKLTVEQQMGRCSPPSVLLVQNSVVFVGSLISRSVLLHSQTSEPDKNASLSADGYDNEIDIAWNSTKTRLTISPCDAIEDPGAFIKATFCLRPHGETSLVATSGLDTLGGFSIFNPVAPASGYHQLPSIAYAWFVPAYEGYPNSMLPIDGLEKQAIKDTDGNTPRAKIRSASILDPYILILREDDTLGLFIGEPSRGKVRRKDMSALGDKKTRYLAASFYDDRLGCLKLDEGDARTSMSSPAPSPSHWLVLCRTTGIVELWSLPRLSLVFASNFTDGPPVLQADPPEPSSPMAETPAQVEVEVTETLIANLGETMPTPYLFILFKSGLLFIYQLVPIPSTGSQKLEDGRSHSSLSVQFVKRMVQQLSEKEIEEPQLPSVVGVDKRASRSLVPFTVVDQRNIPKSAVFLTGEDSHWIMKGDKTDVMFMHSDYTVVYAFTSCSMWDNTPTFLMSTEEGTSLVEWIGDLSFHGHFAFERIRKGRTYSNIASDSTTGLIVAVSCADQDFVLYDDEGTNVWERDAPNVSYPVLGAVALELIDPASWATIDGYEFGTNEVVNALEVVRLETLSTSAGNKDFIAVGTSIHRGEDLAVRGGTYIFDVAEVVQDTEAKGKRKHKLKLLCKEEAKGPVTALCEINGYLVSSMGQKIFVRAFDLNERLVGVAFLDAGTYVTSVRCLKNFLMITDVVKSVWFVAFQASSVDIRYSNLTL